MIVIPAIHNLDNIEYPEQKGWGWHKVSELVEAVNYHLALQDLSSVTASTIHARFGQLNRMTDSVGIRHSAMPARFGIKGDDFHEYIRNSIDLTRATFVPARWGLDIIDSIKHPKRSFLKRVLGS
jgi:hypothetical protein